MWWCQFNALKLEIRIMVLTKQRAVVAPNSLKVNDKSPRRSRPKRAPYRRFVSTPTRWAYVFSMYLQNFFHRTELVILGIKVACCLDSSLYAKLNSLSKKTVITFQAMISDCLHYWECVANYLRLLYKEGVWIWLFLCNFQWYFLQVCSVEKIRIASQWLRPSLNINNSLSPAECWKEILSHGLTQKKIFRENNSTEHLCFHEIFLPIALTEFLPKICGG